MIAYYSVLSGFQVGSPVDLRQFGQIRAIAVPGITSGDLLMQRRDGASERHTSEQRRFLTALGNAGRWLNKDKPRQLEVEARELQTKLDRFMRAIGDGERPKTILAEIKRLETRLQEIKGEQQRLSEAVPVMTAAQIRDKCGTN